mgnify:CR=1 FL=1
MQPDPPLRVLAAPVVALHSVPAVDGDGSSQPYNPNGAARDVAGMCDRSGRVLGRSIGGSQPLLLRSMALHESPGYGEDEQLPSIVGAINRSLQRTIGGDPGYAETIADDTGLDPGLCGRFGAIIRSEARRMLRIVEDLMSLSRIEADRFVAPRDMVSPAELLRRAAERGREKGLSCAPIRFWNVVWKFVLKARCVGMPDDVLGERSCAYVVPRGAVSSAWA